MNNTLILKPKERLQRLSDELDVSIRQLARLTGINEATLYHVTDESRDISGRTAARLCYQIEKKRGLLVNRDWLLTGKGKMLVDLSDFFCLGWSDWSDWSDGWDLLGFLIGRFFLIGGLDFLPH